MAGKPDLGKRSAKARLAGGVGRQPQETELETCPHEYVKSLFAGAASGMPAERATRGAAKRRPKLESRTLNDIISEVAPLAVPVRGRWMRLDHVGLRNAAWAVRNARWAGQDETMMVAWLCKEVNELLSAGEPVESVVP